MKRCLPLVLGLLLGCGGSGAADVARKVDSAAQSAADASQQAAAAAQAARRAAEAAAQAAERAAEAADQAAHAVEEATLQAAQQAADRAAEAAREAQAAAEAADGAARAAEGTPPLSDGRAPVSEAAPVPEGSPPPEAAPVSEVDRSTPDPIFAALFAPLPEAFRDPQRPLTLEKVALGRMLWFDPRLSVDSTVSCDSCHPLNRFGADGAPRSTGVGEHLGGRNAPSVFNAAGHVAQFWDGRAADVEEQALGPILASIEMGMPDAGAVTQRLSAIPGYVAAFDAAFPEDGLTWANLGEALGAFERGLVTPGRWDAYLRGYHTLSDAEVRGARAFVSNGCAACHGGALVGGSSFMKLGLVEPWPTIDRGREVITGAEADRFVFKVPSLRNVTRTGPWLHDGSVDSLEQVVHLMGRHQLGRQVSDADVDDILAFLGALEGTVDAAYVAEPALPSAPEI